MHELKREPYSTSADIAADKREIAREKFLPLCDIVSVEPDGERKDELKKRLLEMFMSGGFDRGVVNGWLEQKGKIPLGGTVHLLSRENYRRLVDYIAGDVDFYGPTPTTEHEEIKDSDLPLLSIYELDEVHLVPNIDISGIRRPITGEDSYERAVTNSHIQAFERYLFEHNIQASVYYPSNIAEEDLEKLRMIRKTNYVPYFLPEQKSVIFLCPEERQAAFIVRLSGVDSELTTKDLVMFFGSFSKKELGQLFPLEIVQKKIVSEKKTKWLTTLFNKIMQTPSFQKKVALEKIKELAALARQRPKIDSEDAALHELSIACEMFVLSREYLDDPTGVFNVKWMQHHGFGTLAEWTTFHDGMVMLVGKSQNENVKRLFTERKIDTVDTIKEKFLRAYQKWIDLGKPGIFNSRFLIDHDFSDILDWVKGFSGNMRAFLDTEGLHEVKASYSMRDRKVSTYTRKSAIEIMTSAHERWMNGGCTVPFNVPWLKKNGFGGLYVSCNSGKLKELFGDVDELIRNCPENVQRSWKKG